MKNGQDLDLSDSIPGPISRLMSLRLTIGLAQGLVAWLLLEMLPR
jgi:hypothetical protein